jgi:uncharacterized protein (TIGR02117 family)
LVVLMVAGCVSTSVAPYTGAAPRTQAMYLISNGWHTEVVLPANEITGRLAVFRKQFAGARFLVFGWGERAFYMAGHPTSGEAMRALFPAPSVLLVMGLARMPRQAFAASVRVSAIRISRIGIARLSRYIWSYAKQRRDGKPRRLSAGPSAASAFYASTGTYDAFHTCNTWTAEALHVAGEPVSAAGVIFAGQVTGQVQRIKRIKGQGATRHQR